MSFSNRNSADERPSMDEHNACEYLETALTVFVIGASGDLAKKKTYPSLFALYASGYLPEHVVIVGYARSAKKDDDFRKQIAPYIKPKTSEAEDKKGVNGEMTWLGKSCHAIY